VPHTQCKLKFRHVSNYYRTKLTINSKHTSIMCYLSCHSWTVTSHAPLIPSLRNSWVCPLMYTNTKLKSFQFCPAATTPGLLSQHLPDALRAVTMQPHFQRPKWILPTLSTLQPDFCCCFCKCKLVLDHCICQNKSLKPPGPHHHHRQ